MKGVAIVMEIVPHLENYSYCCKTRVRERDGEVSEKTLPT